MNKELWDFLPAILLIIMTFAIVLGNLIAKGVNYPFQKLQDTIDFFASNDKLPPGASIEKENFYFAELNQLRSTLGKAFSALQEKRVLEKTCFNLAAEVSHDIRSPLAALNTLLKASVDLPEERRIILRNAIRRMNDIANNLLEQYKINKNSGENTVAEKINPELISSLLDSLISEKRVQFSDNQLDLQLDIDDSAYGSFVDLESNDFKRMISNLINNAIEAMESKGDVRITLTKVFDNLVIKIIDNGSGIPEDVLPKIKQGGTSVGKKEGSGLGISNAIQHIKKWNGEYDIQSKVGEGTTFTIELPMAEEPHWFQTSIDFLPKTHVVIVDDDESIHQVWEMHFQEYLKNGQITLDHFYKPSAFSEYCNTSVLDNDLFLVDYEFMGFKETGLDLIEQCHLKDKAILVTSRYEEHDVRTRVKELGIKIVPKNFAPYIPVLLAKPFEQPDLILIDDSLSFTQSWEMCASLKNKKIAAFNRSKDFKKVMHRYNKDIPIYIDSDLREALPGEKFAKFLYDQGFKELYLATGYDSDRFDDLPWIKKIVSKDLPF